MISRCLLITWLFLKEQLKEPIAFCWIVLSPSILFYVLARTHPDAALVQDSYSIATGGYYTYVASTVAFFGFSLYIIGRRESGFMRT